MKTRINPKTGREEFWNEPLGLPGIWMTRGFCDRCYPFNKCLGLMELSENEWNNLEKMVDELVNNPSKLEVVFDNRQLKKCSV